jgi:hypothetical protein
MKKMQKIAKIIWPCMSMKLMSHLKKCFKRAIL